METTEERTEVDWKDSMLKFMKLTGETSNEWHPELWESYGITSDHAKEIIDEYERRFT
jgi:hypothetical protein